MWCSESIAVPTETEERTAHVSRGRKVQWPTTRCTPDLIAKRENVGGLSSRHTIRESPLELGLVLPK